MACSWNSPASTPAGAITPVLGGVGPMAIMSLMHNALVASRGRRLHNSLNRNRFKEKIMQ
ncbi:hypothetical protein [Rhizobium leguminosarum]|uniref:hypothetical protein n=1 Tax=Rhizobium TaxID=379 RepID=UPI00248484D0